VRTAAGVQKVPTFQVWANGKELKESYLAQDVNEVIPQVSEMLDRHLEGVMDTSFRYLTICPCLFPLSRHVDYKSTWIAVFPMKHSRRCALVSFHGIQSHLMPTNYYDLMSMSTVSLSSSLRPSAPLFPSHCHATKIAPHTNSTSLQCIAET
jgi:hypothetical protein